MKDVRSDREREVVRSPLLTFVWACGDPEELKCLCERLVVMPSRDDNGILLTVHGRVQPQVFLVKEIVNGLAALAPTGDVEHTSSDQVLGERRHITGAWPLLSRDEDRIHQAPIKDRSPLRQVPHVPKEELTSPKVGIIRITNGVRSCHGRIMPGSRVTAHLARQTGEMSGAQCSAADALNGASLHFSGAGKATGAGGWASCGQGGLMVKALLITSALLAGSLAGCSTSHHQASGGAAPTTIGLTSTSPTRAASPASSSTVTPSARSATSQVRDVTFISATTGWVLVGGELDRTSDSGLSWMRVGPAPAHVTQLRFASANVGYAWRPDGALRLTTDGGRTWLFGGLVHMASLEVGDGVVWAITGPLPGPRVHRSGIGSTAWTNLGLGPNRSATLDVHGDLAYVTGQQGAGPVPPALSVWTANGDRRDERLPCPQHTVTPFSPLGVSTDGVVVLICNEEHGTGTRPLAYVSNDEARTWNHIPGPPQAPADVTANRTGAFAWASSIMLLHAGQWHVVLDSHTSRGFELVGFITDALGVALTYSGRLYRSTDSGHTWNPITVGND